MEEMPARSALVSVIIPAYQAAPTLARALDSALQQDYPHIEIIVADDGSTDDTRQIVAGYMTRDPRVRYFWQANQGCGAARNSAVAHARGEYLAFLDGDDEWRPGKLRLQAAILSQFDSIDFVFTNGLDVDTRAGRTQLLSKRHARAIRTLNPTPLPQHADVFAVSAERLRLAVLRFGLILEVIGHGAPRPV